MVGWQRHLQSLLRQVGKRVEYGYNASINFSCSRSKSSLVLGEVPYSQRQCTFYEHLKAFISLFTTDGISSSRKLLADSSEIAPISSPLTPVLASNSGKTENQKAVSKPAKVQAVLKGIKQSPKKVNLVAALVRGMRVEDALLQFQVIHSARANATHNHGLDPDRLLVAEAFLGKGFFKKRVSYHAKGKSGIKVRPECTLTVVLRELTPEEEAEIARLRVHNFCKLTQRERQLVPHKLIETTAIWSRKSKANSGVTSGMAS